MNELEKLFAVKKTENGDISYKTTGDNLTDLFFMTPYFEKHLDQVHIGTTDKEKVFSMFVRDPRFGLGRRDLGRRLMVLSNLSPIDTVKAGRYDDLWHNPNDGLPLYNELKKLEVKKSYYWLEESILALLRRYMITLIEEQLKGYKDDAYQAINNDDDKIISMLYFATKNMKITTFNEIKELLSNQSLLSLNK